MGVKMEIRGGFLKVTNKNNSIDRFIRDITNYHFDRKRENLFIREPQATNQVTHRYSVSELVDFEGNPFSSFNDLDFFLEYNLAVETVSGDKVITQQADKYSLLTEGDKIGSLAYVKDSEGTKWLPNNIGGSYNPKGFYVWNGLSWISDRDAIASQFHALIAEMENKIEEAPIGDVYARKDKSWALIDSIVGDKGEKGYKGDKGDKGEDGSDGIQGIQGIQGEQGIQGLKGEQGDKGDKGDNGSNGTSVSFFQVQDNLGEGQDLLTSYKDVSGIWGTAFEGEGFSWNGIELTLNEYSNVLEFNVSVQGITDYNNRVQVNVMLLEDSGSGYEKLTEVSQYSLRNNIQNEGNVNLSSFCVFNVNVGTKYKIQVLRKGANSKIGTQGGTYFNTKRYH